MDDPQDRWFAEAMAIELDKRDFDVAEAAELPSELMHYAAAADGDPQFQESFEEWLEWLLDKEEAFGCSMALLALEQSASSGVLLPWSMRGVRLASVEEPVIDTLHFFWSHCPKHVAAYLTNYVYWLVRSERARRRGTPLWSPLAPEPE